MGKVLNTHFSKEHFSYFFNIYFFGCEFFCLLGLVALFKFFCELIFIVQVWFCSCLTLSATENPALNGVRNWL